MQNLRFAIVLSLVVCFVGVPSLLRAQEKDVVIEGQVKLGVHKFMLENGSLYQFEIKAKDFSPSVSLSGAFLLNTADFKERNTFRASYFPSKSQEHTLVITPHVGLGDAAPAGLLDYTVTLKTMKLDETPLLKKEDKLAAEDPAYTQGFNRTHFKAYTIKMNKGRTYIIDMVRVNPAENRLDPYLFLEDADKKVVAQDDDSGGNLNARIVFRALADGEPRVIATGLNNMRDTGAYTLTVRTVKTEK